ncbi:TetR/AcrR family transcriptional regulator [Hymenobacter sp. BT507]|uniref:TetR/AcrR family transcriptional regulator n=1 Tax=Hymenobacter citatus TaxID=2763506 RepID=A0ABR7MKN4_9BACT|nr:TetR/AcrR family transcriptional regulator [Hymenobacter citatus]MBC6611113.1 TetR/AcrR family transcriptional regulator [Hymenobacter citatus]
MGVKERKQREKEYREQSILAAAKTVFLTKGLVAATIDDIAAAAELGKGTLYRHYRSKEDIMLALSEQAFRELHQRYVAAVAKGGSGLDKLLRTRRAFFQFTMENPAYFGFIAFFESPFSTNAPEQLADIATTTHQLMMELRDEGIADGSMRKDIDANLLAYSIWGTSYGMMQFIVNKGSYLMEPQHTDPAAQFEAYIMLLESGLRAPAG